MNTFLISGVSSGLGKFLHERLGGFGLHRQTPPAEWAQIKTIGVDVVIHCAANASKTVDSNSLGSYANDNVFLTDQLLSISHRKFIFISSVDVYPKNSKLHSEEEAIPIDQVGNVYAITKLMSESLVKARSKNFAVLRASAFLGKYARPSSLIKIIQQEHCSVTLVPDSEVNCIDHEDVLHAIQQLIKGDMSGTFNVASSKNITLAKVADMFGRKVRYGTYCYRVGLIDNRKIASIWPAFKKTSQEVIESYAAREMVAK